MKLILSVLLTGFISSAWACGDAELIQKGFKFHPNNFDYIKNKILNKLNQQAEYFVLDEEQMFWSNAHKQYFNLISKDDIRTEQMEMFGDVVLIKDDNRVKEIRWYHKGEKHFAYSTDHKCATNLIPFADNALY